VTETEMCKDEEERGSVWAHGSRQDKRVPPVNVTLTCLTAAGKDTFLTKTVTE